MKAYPPSSSLAVSVIYRSWLYVVLIVTIMMLQCTAWMSSVAVRRRVLSTTSTSLSAAKRSLSATQITKDSFPTGVKTLVIVESPAKAKTIQNFLKDISEDYIVDYSAGHIREIASSKDLPKNFENKIVQPGLRIKTSDLGIDVFDHFKPIYTNVKGKSELIQRLKQKAKEVDRILLATDEDREGEAISWHLVNLLNPKVPYQVSTRHIFC